MQLFIDLSSVSCPFSSSFIFERESPLLVRDQSFEDISKYKENMDYK